MGSTLISKARTYLKALKPLLHQGNSGFFTIHTSLCKSQKLPPTASSLCSNEANHDPGGSLDRRTSAPKSNTVRHREEELWDSTQERRGKSFTLRQRPSFPKSVFAAGTAKRTAEMLKRKAVQVEEPAERAARREGKVKPPDRPLSAAEWRTMKESSSANNPQRFDVQMMCALFTSGSELDIAKSLLTFVAMETGSLSYELLLRYLTLCVSGGHDAEVFDVYDIMRGSFPSLDTGACSLFIKSFSRTARWKEAISVLQEIKKVLTPSPRNYGDIITGALLHGDLITAWALYDELIAKGLSPQPETWESLFGGAKKSQEEKEEEEESETISQSEHQERLRSILLYMRNNQEYPQQSLAGSIKSWFESLAEQKWTGSWTTITPKGVCGCCGSELESIQLTAEEYQQLRDKVMTDIIQGRDVFKKTTPEELEKFKTFVKRKPPFDVVVDGLNVANIAKDKCKLSDTLLAVVSELEHQGLTVLVLGRKHMLRPSKSWDRHNMNLIQQKAHCFFTDNISEDDPFLLYATLHSGNHCRFVSRDLMRDHKACLPDGATRRLFFKWQRGHQLVTHGYVTAGRRVRFQSIPPYDTILQTSGDSWHIPYDDTEDRSTYEVPQRWICLTKTH
ncbi:hypothetical protein LDENG_00166560 [Lucifuga dentata]|nr:hypothetical protein LDENG_00166560 [Lucifuga dentata]